MKIIRTSVELNHWFNEHNNQNNKSLGLVPTMGALHQGHASLIEKASKECDLVVVSILVNPTQFNEKDDLDAYPRTMDADAEIAKAAGCNVIFSPTAEDLYGGKPKAEHMDWGSLTHSFEGKCRPGHFDGVIAVVDKLFGAIKPVSSSLANVLLNAFIVPKKVFPKLLLFITTIFIGSFFDEI